MDVLSAATFITDSSRYSCDGEIGAKASRSGT